MFVGQLVLIAITLAEGFREQRPDFKSYIIAARLSRSFADTEIRYEVKHVPVVGDGKGLFVRHAAAGLAGSPRRFGEEVIRAARVFSGGVALPYFALRA